MQFEEKKDIVIDDGKNTGGLPFTVLALLLAIMAMICVVVLKHAGVDFNFKISNGYTTLLTCLDIVMRITGTFFLVIGVRVAYRKMFLYDNNVKWYKIIICMIVGSTLMIFGSSIVIFYAKSLVYFYY